MKNKERFHGKLETAKEVMEHNQYKIQELLLQVESYIEQNLMIRYLLKEQGIKNGDLPPISTELEEFCQEFIEPEDWDKETGEAFKAQFLTIYLSGEFWDKKDRIRKEKKAVEPSVVH